MKLKFYQINILTGFLTACLMNTQGYAADSTKDESVGKAAHTLTSGQAPVQDLTMNTGRRKRQEQDVKQDDEQNTEQDTEQNAEQSNPAFKRRCADGAVGESVGKAATVRTKTWTNDLSLVGYFMEFFDDFSSLMNLNEASTPFRNSAISFCIDSYATAVITDMPVPETVKKILSFVRTKEERTTITALIAETVHRKTGGYLMKQRPMPPFLDPFFKNIPQRELPADTFNEPTLSLQIEAVTCIEVPSEADTFNEPTLSLQIEAVTCIEVPSAAVKCIEVPSAAVLHILTCMKSYESRFNAPNAEQASTFLHTHVQRYVTLEQALKRLQKDQTFIIVDAHFTTQEATWKKTKLQIHEVFKTRPELTLVVDFGDAVKTGRFFGAYYPEGCDEIERGDNEDEDQFLDRKRDNEQAFEDTSRLDKFRNSIPDSVKRIAVIGRNLTKISGYFMYHYSELTSVVITRDVTEIGNFFLLECSSLAFFDIPPKLTEIQDSFLNCCDRLTSLCVHRGVRQIGAYFLFDCMSLKSLVIESNNLTEIGDDFLEECSTDYSVAVNGSLTTFLWDVLRKNNPKLVRDTLENLIYHRPILFTERPSA
ncbi:MAG: leucine-rich repeat domain-containing protein [Pseudomonadota bacterium]